jgi:hypothetical protein
MTTGDSNDDENAQCPNKAEVDGRPKGAAFSKGYWDGMRGRKPCFTRVTLPNFVFGMKDNEPHLCSHINGTVDDVTKACIE